jgi:hypothetical protein|tara:strand:- start:1941 stop:2294 length:354 start_codon:yes stop_codon:yes gene_type:complete
MKRHPVRMFYHRLAIALGMTVGEMLRKMSSSEMADWIAFWRLDPWGEERADLRSGIIAAVTANVWSGKGRKAKPADFMPNFVEPDRPRQSMESQKAIFSQAAMAFSRVRARTQSSNG